MARPVHIFDMFKHLRAFVFLLASITTVYCGDALQTTHLDNSTLQHQSKRNTGTTQYQLPFAGEIRHPMFNGKEIKVQGNILQNPNRLTVDLCETRTCLLDIEFQVEYRFKTERLSLNNKRNLQWGPAVFSTGKHLKAGKALNMTIVINSNQFQVFFDNTKFVMNATARMTKIKYIRIRGSAHIDWILYSWTRPGKYFYFNPELQQQRLIWIGHPTANTRFYINFIHVNYTSRPDDCMLPRVAVHFDSRFCHDGDWKRLLLVWFAGYHTPRTYMHFTSFPYELNVRFRNQVTIRNNQFEFLVNGLVSHNYKRSPDGVRVICIGGAVVVEKIYTT